MERRPRKPTLSELARKAGVSKTVVSVVANRQENRNVRVREKKRQEIIRLIDRSRFVTSKTAWELVSQRTNTIAVILHKRTPYFSHLLEELHKQAFEKELEIMPCITGGYAVREEAYLNLMRDQRADGIIIAAIVNGRAAHYMKFFSPPYNLKMLLINEPTEKELEKVIADARKTLGKD